MAINYEKYWLSRIISVQAILSADYRQNWIFDGEKLIHVHQDAWELIVCLTKSIRMLNGEEEVTLQQGQLILIQPGVRHCIVSGDEDANVFVLSFVCNNDRYLFSLQNRILNAQDSSFEIIHSMIRELKYSFVLQQNTLHLSRFIPNSTSPVGAEQMICCYLEQFLILLLRDTTTEQGAVATTSGFHRVFQTYLSDQVTTYIQDNISASLTVQSIADHFHYSRARLSALYKEATGVSISDTIINTRIQAAKKMLHKGGYSIAQISESLGFSSPQYFSYKFAKITGFPPTQYCKKRKKNTSNNK